MEFPLIDRDEVFVSRVCRIHHERRRTNIMLEVIELLLSLLLHKEPSRR